MEPITINLDTSDLRKAIELVERLRDLLIEVRKLLAEISPKAPAPSMTAEEFATQVASLFGNLPPLTDIKDLEE